MVDPTNTSLKIQINYINLINLLNISPKDQALFPLAGPPSVKAKPCKSLLILCSPGKDTVLVPFMIGDGRACSGCFRA